MRKLLLIIIILSLASCSYIPFVKKKAPEADTKRAQKGEKVEEGEPKPGDIKVIDGVEYIYARNRKFATQAAEPEYVWLRKDQYSPGLFEGITQAAAGRSKEQTEMEKRIAKLEEDLRKKNIAPQIVYPQQATYLPQTQAPAYAPMAPPQFNYPSAKMRRRVLVLPIADQTNYKNEQLGELATRRLVSRLESSGAIIAVDPSSLNGAADLSDPKKMTTLNQLYGIQAVVKGTLSDIYTSTSRVEGKEAEASFALSRISLDIYNTDTGTLLKQVSARNPVFLSREKGEMSSEKAKAKAIDLSIELIADDLLKAILMLDWHARIASIEDQKIYINAGRLSGLDKGDTLEVYSPGEQIIDARTKLPLGTTKGAYKGEVEVADLFGVDASWGKAKTGGNFSPTDLVYVKK